MLTRHARLHPRYVNFFSGSPLNRLAWLRTSQPFLNAIIHAPTTRWLVFNQGQPLVQTSAPAAPAAPFKQSLVRLTTRDVRPLLGPEPFFSQGQHPGELAPADVKTLEAARLRGAPVAFLGLHETEASFAAALPSTDFSAQTDVQTVIANIKGDAYFSLDVSDVPKEEVNAVLAAAKEARGGAELAFVEPRSAMSNFELFESAIFAEARCIIDWNARNKVRLVRQGGDAARVHLSRPPVDHAR